MTIDWTTERIPNTDRRRDGATDTRLGQVGGVDRFRISFVEGDGWLAVDLLAPEADPGATFTGSYLDCVEWCWGRGG